MGDRRPGSVLRRTRRVAVLRSLYYSWRWGGQVVVGRRTHIAVARGAVVRLRRGARLVVGIDPPGRPATVEVGPGARVEFGGSAALLGGTHVHVLDGAVLTVGDGTYLNADSRVTCARSIEIGAGCAISWNVTIIDDDVHELRRASGAGGTGDPLVIADRVWLGASSVVLKGVHIGEGSVVGAGSVVTRSIPARTLAAGNPARPIEADVDWRL